MGRSQVMERLIWQYFSVNTSCERLGEVSAASWFPQALSQFSKVAFSPHLNAWTGNSPWELEGWVVGMHHGDSDRPTSIILSLAKPQASCHIVQDTGLWEFPDEAWYPHPNSVQQHGHLKNRAWAHAPVARLGLLALTSTHHKERARPFHLSSYGQGFYQEWIHLPKLCCLPATCLP